MLPRYRRDQLARRARPRAAHDRDWRGVPPLRARRARAIVHRSRSQGAQDYHSQVQDRPERAVDRHPNGQRIAPVALLEAWLAQAEIGDGPLFRKLTPQGCLTAEPMSAQGVAIVVKQRAQGAGYDADLFAGHSLRAGFLTAAESRSASVFKMRDQNRYKSLEMVGEQVRDHDAFRDQAGDGFLREELVRSCYSGRCLQKLKINCLSGQVRHYVLGGSYRACKGE